MKEQFDLPKDGMSLKELAQLEGSLHAAEDVFALDDTERGHTSLVQHGVATSVHPPVTPTSDHPPVTIH